MTDEPTERSTRRWLTAGSHFPAKLYAVLLLCGSFALFYGPLGFEGVGLIWIPTAAAILLSIPLFFLLRVGDRRVDRWWARRAPDTRLALRRLGWGTLAALQAAGGVFMIATAPERKGSTGSNTAAGLALVGFCAVTIFRAVREKRREA